MIINKINVIFFSKNQGVYLRLKTVEDSANVVAGSHVMIVLGNDKGY